MNVPNGIVAEGLIRGAKCPISGRRFVAHDPTREQLAALHAEQVKFTRELIFRLDGGVERSDRSPADYCDQYRILGDPAEEE